MPDLAPFQFIYEIDSFVLPEKAYCTWLLKIASSHSVHIESLTYIFVDDNKILDINIQFLQHNYYTDIITFPYKEGDIISGEIFISVDRVRENSSSFSVSFTEELLRVMAHGLLHLIGFSDQTEEEKGIMRRQEEKAISLFYN